MTLRVSPSADNVESASSNRYPRSPDACGPHEERPTVSFGTTPSPPAKGYLTIRRDPHISQCLRILRRHSVHADGIDIAQSATVTEP